MISLIMVRTVRLENYLKHIITSQLFQGASSYLSEFPLNFFECTRMALKKKENNNIGNSLAAVSMLTSIVGGC